MADPAVVGSVPPELSTHATSPLLAHALGMALDHVGAAHDSAERWRFGPLVLVSPVEDAAAAALKAAAAARALVLDPAVVIFRDGGSLDREIAAALAADRGDRLVAEFSGRRLVVVDCIDRVAGDDRQAALVHLLDAADRCGTVWVVSTRVHPAAGAGSPRDSRLSGGLVVPLAASLVRPASPGGRPSLARIVRAASRLHDVQPATVVGPSRSRTVAAARSLAMYLARRLTDHSLQEIGAACGGRDHSTVLHGVRVCASRITRDPAFATEVETLVGALAGGIRVESPREESGPHAVGSAALARGLRGRHRGRRRLA